MQVRARQTAKKVLCSPYVFPAHALAHPCQQNRWPMGCLPTACPADSQSSSPHSTSTHQSSLQHSLSDVQGADAGHAVAPQATLPSTPTAEQNDMRTAERQVLLALAERASGRGSRLGMAPPATAAPAAAAADVFEGAELPPWLVHWRLRAALSSQQLFTELFIELSEAAARCYLQCGYLRNAALLNSDVADALAKAGSLRRAATLYERQCRTFLRQAPEPPACLKTPTRLCRACTYAPVLALALLCCL